MTLRQAWTSLVKHVPFQSRPVDEPATGPPPPPAELIDFLRQLGVALVQSGTASNKVTEQLEDLAHRYNADGVRFMVLPTTVFVRMGSGELARADFANVSSGMLRLDQVGMLYRLVQECRRTALPPREAIERLEEIRRTPPRFPVLSRVVGQAILTVGLGLVLNPSPSALVGYVVLGLLVGLLNPVGERFPPLALAMPVAAALMVTLLAFWFRDILAGGHPSQLLIPPLVMLLPGAALTNAAIELAAGSMVAGASRLAYGFYNLLLLALGILAGLQIVKDSATVETGHVPSLGDWSPLVGVLLVGVGFFVSLSAPPRSLGWVLLVLYAVWGIKMGGTLLGSGVLGAFLGGLAIVPATTLVDRRESGPPAEVIFLPSFWLLVPGAASLAGMSDALTGGSAAGLTSLVTVIITVVAIALGMLVGSSLVTIRRGRPSARPVDT